MEVAMSLEEQNENKNLEHLDKEALKLESELESENGESLLVGDDGGQMSPEEKEALERRKMDAFLTLGLFSILELVLISFLNRKGIIPHTLPAFVVTVVIGFIIFAIVIKVLEKYFKL